MSPIRAQPRAGIDGNPCLHHRTRGVDRLSFVTHWIHRQEAICLAEGLSWLAQGWVGSPTVVRSERHHERGACPGIPSLAGTLSRLTAHQPRPTGARSSRPPPACHMPADRGACEARLHLAFPTGSRRSPRVPMVPPAPFKPSCALVAPPDNLPPRDNIGGSNVSPHRRGTTAPHPRACASTVRPTYAAPMRKRTPPTPLVPVAQLDRASAF